ncbi:MAG: membrane protein insertion efficiency factor YidD [Prolixibacteraceae bacterium]|nr:membrane protein insertion efficiency factor YidD [Prolixibacteraceae bacterium]
MPNLLQRAKPNKSTLLFLVFLLIAVAGRAQEIDMKSDLILIDSVEKQQIPISTKREYIFKDQKIAFKNSNPASLVFGGLLYGYQNYFSQHLSANCLFNPSCSDFSKQAVKEFGLVKGTLLSFDRLSRCNRIAATDLNPTEIDEHTHRFHDPINCFK